MAEVTVTVFGPVAATVGGTGAELGGPRQRAVLGMLVAAAGRVVSVDRLLDDLWPAGPPPHGLGSLHAYVSHLRRILEPERRPRTPASVLVSAVPGYTLRLPGDAVDVWRFDALAAAAGRAGDPGEVVVLASRALDTWSAEPYAAYPDAGWATTEAARLREVRAGVAELRGAAALRLGRPREVLGDPLLRADPLREPAVALRARALYRTGRQAEALAELRALRGRLAAELGLDPGPELRSLEEAVLRQDPALDGPVHGGAGRSAPASAGRSAPAPAGGSRPAPAAPDAPDAPDELAAGPGPVGRGPELARLAAVTAAPAAHPVVAWVEGEAGSGKSTVVEAMVRASPLHPARGRCPEAGDAPPGRPWHEVLAVLDPAGPGPAGGAFDLAERVGRAAAGYPGGVLVVLEDLHRADQETLQVLREVVTAGRGPAAVVGTFRTDEVGPDLRATLAATTGRTADRLLLTGLPDAAARTVLRAAAGRELPEAVRRSLVERAAGNPLFLRQLGELVALDGPGGAAAVPRALRDLLTRRLEQLPARVVSTLSRAAVLGRDIDVDLLVEITPARGGATEEDTIDDLDAAVVAGLLEVAGPDGLRFVHVLVRDTAYERIPPLRRARLHLAALDALERRTGPGDRTFALAEHAARSLGPGTAARALPHLERAARRSGAGGAPDRAAGWWRAVLAAHRHGAGSTAGLLGAHRALVAAVADGGDRTAARQARDDSLAAARALGDDADLARAWPVPAPALWTARPFDPADSAARAAEIGALLDRIGPADPVLRTELLVARAQEAEPWLVDVALPSAREAVDLARRIGDPRLRCRALNAWAVHAFADDDVTVLARCAADLIAAATEAGAADHLALGHLVAASDAVGRADPDDRDRHLDAAVRAARTGQLGAMLLATEIAAATDALLRGRIGDARDRFATVTDRLAAEGDPNSAIIRGWARATVELAAGDTAPLVAELAELAPRVHGAVDDLLVTALVDAGRPDEARAVAAPDPWPRDATWLAVTALRARNAVLLGDHDAVRRAHDALRPWSGRLVCTGNGLLVLGPVDLFLAGAARALGDDVAADRYAGAAGALAGRLGATHWAERARRA